MSLMIEGAARSRGGHNVQEEPEPPAPAKHPAAAFSPPMIVIVAVWMGLVTASIELFIFWFRWRFIDATALSSLQLNQHAMWMVPLSDAVIFAGAGLGVAVLARLTHSRRVAGLGVAALCALAVYALLLTYRGLSSLACGAMSAGVGFRLGLLILAHPRSCRRVILATAPVLVGATVLAWSMEPSRERLAGHGLPPAPAGAPNVLFIVMDTVRAESLGADSQGRTIAPVLDRLARRGVRFEQARSSAPWTLPSHASMFTGRLPHELSTRLDQPLDSTYETIAEFVHAHGYDTAGFVANTFFCSRWFGLARGFVHYEDVAIDAREIFRSSGLGRSITRKLSTSPNDRPTAYFERKDATTINAELMGWLRRRPKGRPYFAFLNYYDAHDPYLTPEEEGRRSSRASRSAAELDVLRDWHRTSRNGVRPEHVRLARESYEECIGYLDRQIGRLLEGLEAMGALENTIVVITSDHGEEFGEHGFFGHGQRLYSQVLHVPLLLIAPGRIPRGRRIATPVSLSSLPATLVDLLGLSTSSPFPGGSLARYWNGRGHRGASMDALVLSEIDDDDGRRREGPPARAIVSEGKVYIHSDGEREELYDLWSDPSETHDLSHDPANQEILARLRRLTDGQVTAIATGPATEFGSPGR